MFRLDEAESPSKEPSQSIKSTVTAEEQLENKQSNDGIIIENSLELAKLKYSQAESLLEQKKLEAAIFDYSATITQAKKTIDTSSTHTEEPFDLIDNTIRRLANIVSENEDILSTLPQNNITVTLALTLIVLSSDDKYNKYISTFQQLQNNAENHLLLSKARALLVNSKFVEQMATEDKNIAELVASFMQLTADKIDQVAQLATDFQHASHIYHDQTEKSMRSSSQLEGPADVQLDQALHELLSVKPKNGSSSDDDNDSTEENRKLFREKLQARQQRTLHSVDISKNPSHFFSAPVRTGLGSVLTGAFVYAAYTAGLSVALWGGLYGFMVGYTAQTLYDNCKSKRPHPGQ